MKISSGRDEDGYNEIRVTSTVDSEHKTTSPDHQQKPQHSSTPPSLQDGPAYVYVTSKDDHDDKDSIDIVRSVVMFAGSGGNSHGGGM